MTFGKLQRLSPSITEERTLSALCPSPYVRGLCCCQDAGGVLPALLPVLLTPFRLQRLVRRVVFGDDAGLFPLRTLGEGFKVRGALGGAFNPAGRCRWAAANAGP